MPGVASIAATATAPAISILMMAAGELLPMLTATGIVASGALIVHSAEPHGCALCGVIFTTPAPGMQQGIVQSIIACASGAATNAATKSSSPAALKTRARKRLRSIEMDDIAISQTILVRATFRHVSTGTSAYDVRHMPAAGLGSCTMRVGGSFHA